MRKILVVADSASMRQMIRFTLRQGGFDVVEAEHGQDDLNKLETITVDPVLTDLNMPVMDGITLIKNIRKLPAMKLEPILRLTTEGLAAKKDEGKSVGAMGWLVKPFDPDKGCPADFDTRYLLDIGGTGRESLDALSRSTRR